MKTVRNVNIKANTKDHLAGLRTANNSFQPCKPIVCLFTSCLSSVEDLVTASVIIFCFLASVTYSCFLASSITAIGFTVESLLAFNSSSIAEENCPNPDVTRSLK